jgi:hypothetical protein
MIAAIQMQWLGVAVAALVVAALLLVVLIRHRSADDRLMAAKPTAGQAVGAPPPAAIVAAPEQTGTFLDEPLSRDFEALGSPSPAGREAAPATPPAAPAAEAASTADQGAPTPAAGPPASSDETPAAAAPALAAHGPFPVDPFGSHDDIFPPDDEQVQRQTPAVAGPAVGPAPAEAAAVEAVPAAEVEPAAAPAGEAGPVSAGEPASEELAPQPAAPGAPTPALLSDILVTTGDAEVDLTDPAVRRLLEQLVADEIELARQCRAQEQTLDAILQLTEAEKVCEALGLDDRLAEVRALLAELQA